MPTEHASRSSDRECLRLYHKRPHILFLRKTGTRLRQLDCESLGFVPPSTWRACVQFHGAARSSLVPFGPYQSYSVDESPRINAMDSHSLDCHICDIPLDASRQCARDEFQKKNGAPLYDGLSRLTRVGRTHIRFWPQSNPNSHLGRVSRLFSRTEIRAGCNHLILACCRLYQINSYLPIGVPC